MTRVKAGRCSACDGEAIIKSGTCTGEGYRPAENLGELLEAEG